MVTIHKNDVGKRIVTKRGEFGDIVEFHEDREYAVIVNMLGTGTRQYQQNGQYYPDVETVCDIEKIVDKGPGQFDPMYRLDSTDYFQKILGW
jgi:hypothetical protein